MKQKFLLLLFLICTAFFANAQTISRKFSRDKYGRKEVPEEKAKYVRNVILNIDSSVTTEMRNIKENTVLWSETYKGSEPYGVWRNGSSIKDFNFKLIYSDAACPKDSISKIIKDIFHDNDSLKYVAPKFSGYKDFFDYMLQALRYPAVARENGIMGKVIVHFIITETGEISDLTIWKGVHVELDKEAARVAREIKFSNPPTLNGKPFSMCCYLPVNFNLR